MGNVDYKKLGSTIEAWRSEAGISVENISQICGVQPRTWMSWVRAERHPKTDQIYWIAEYFGKSIDDMFNRGNLEKF